jgi:chromate reductase
MTKQQRILIINGSIRGGEGNTASLLRVAKQCLPPEVAVDEVVLADYAESVEDLAARLSAADGLLLGSGVYWGSWGSPLQRFLEVMTSFEASECFFGKPAGVVVTMDSVGGTDVAQRLLGVLSTLGCMVPPLAMVVVSRVGFLVQNLEGNEDVWQAEDVRALMQNLVRGIQFRDQPWSAWPSLRIDPIRGRYPGAGIITQGLERFLPADAQTALEGPPDN